MVIEIILAAMLGPLDRLRGGWFPAIDAQIGGLVYGVAIAAMLTHEPWKIAVLMVAFMLGEAPGWGCPLGMALSGRDDGCTREWWQDRRDSPWIDLSYRGFIWGLPIAIAGVFIGVPVALAMPFIFCIAMPLAPAMVRASIGWRDAKHLWPMQEFVRGWLVGLMTLGAVWKF